MRREEYAAVCRALRVSLCEPPDTEAALALGLPGVTQEALVSIHSQEGAVTCGYCETWLSNRGSDLDEF